MKTGIQVSSLKPLLTTPEAVQTTFARMAALGSKYVQLQWIDPAVPIPVIARAVEENGLISISVQDFYETVLEGFEYYTALNAAAGGTWLCVSRIPDRLKSREGLAAFAGELRDMQKKLTPLGQKLCFHPVSADFAAVPGMDAVEFLLEAMPELDICLDLYHLARSCPDMPGWIRRYGSRIPMVHFKDERNGALVPAGSGEINWDGVVAACLEAGVSYGFVEQERWAEDPCDALARALSWLAAELSREGCHD